MWPPLGDVAAWWCAYSAEPPASCETENSLMRRALRAGCVTHNGRVVRVNQGKEIYLKQGDLVKLRKLAPSSLHELPDAEWRTRLIYEDAHIMVIDKPSGASSPNLLP